MRRCYLSIFLTIPYLLNAGCWSNQYQPPLQPSPAVIQKTPTSPLNQEGVKISGSAPGHAVLFKWLEHWPTQGVKFEMLVLDYRRTGQKSNERFFHDTRVIASATINDPQTQKALLKQLDFRANWNDGVPKAAATQGYGLRISVKNKGLDLIFSPGIHTVSCYEYNLNSPEQSNEGYEVYLHSYNNLNFFREELQRRGIRY